MDRPKTKFYCVARAQSKFYSMGRTREKFYSMEERTRARAKGPQGEEGGLAS